MKKIMILGAGVLMLTAMGMTSGCTCPMRASNAQLHPEEYCRIVSKAEHEKRFPGGHVHRANDDPNKRCFFSADSPYYFCQMFDDHDE